MVMDILDISETDKLVSSRILNENQKSKKVQMYLYPDIACLGFAHDIVCWNT